MRLFYRISIFVIIIIFLISSTQISESEEIDDNYGNWYLYRYDENHTGYQKSIGNGIITEYGCKWFKKFENQNNLNHNLIYGEASVADIDLDGEKEIIFGLEDGQLFSLDPNGNTNWIYELDGTISSTPTLFDINNIYPGLEIIITDRSGKISVLTSKGKLIWDFQTEDMIDASAAIGDISGNGENDIVVGSLDHNIYVLDNNGDLIWRYDTGNWIEDAAIIIDINNDNQNDVIVGNGNGNLYAISTVEEIQFENIPYLRKIIYTPQILWEFNTEQVNNIGFTNSPVVIDINKDNNLEIICGAADGNIYCLNNNGKKIWNYDSNGQISKTPAIADINKDGKFEIIFGSEKNLISIDSEGSLLWKKEFNMGVVTNPTLCDIDGDGYLEIITIDEDMERIGQDMSGKKWINSTNIINYKGEIVHKLKFDKKGYDHTYGISIADIENDGKLEILVGTYEGFFYCYGEVEKQLDTTNNDNNNDSDTKNRNSKNTWAVFLFEISFLIIAIIIIIFVIKKIKKK